MNIEKFDNKDFPNTHIEFTESGVKMTVTLNIPKDLKPWLAKNKVGECKKFFVYWCAETLTGTVNRTRIVDCYNYLMNNAMTNVRNAKIQKLESEKEVISQTKILW